MKKIKKITGVSIIVFLLLFSTFVWINKDSIFRSEVVMTYADGCVERYINTELITPICEEGRRLEEGQRLLDFGIPELKWNFTNGT